MKEVIIIKRLIFMLLFVILTVPTATIAAEIEIDYPHFMYRMEVNDFDENFTTLGKRYQSAPVIVPFNIWSAEDSYTLQKFETNDSVCIQADGYGGGYGVNGEYCYESLVNAVYAYFGAEAAQFVRNNFDYAKYSIDGKVQEKIGDYSYGIIKGNNHQGQYIIIKREPIFSDLILTEEYVGTIRQSEVNAVIELFGAGVINGMGEGIFAPDANITRAQFVAMFSRLIGVGDSTYKGSFADVPDGQWYTGVVETFANLGYIKGYDDGNFHPDNTISYQDMFVVAYMYLNDNNLLKEPYSTVLIDDHSGIADYAVTAMDELYIRYLIPHRYLEYAREPGIRIHIAEFLNGIRTYVENAAV